MTKTLRIVLALPFTVFCWIALAIGIGLHALGRAMFRISDGMGHHVFWPVEQVRRIVRGQPRWQVTDLMVLGKQPKTAADRELALASDEITEVVCSCDDPKCAAAKGPIFVPKTAVKRVSFPTPAPPAPPTDAP